MRAHVAVEVGVRKLLLAIVFGMGGAELANACECMERPPVSVCVGRSDAVFSGMVLVVRDSLQLDEDGRGGTPFRVAWIHVEKAWKGVRADTIVTVRTGSGGGDCGFDQFAAGHRYVVFAHGTGLGTSRCDRTAGVRAPWGLIDALGSPISRAKATERER